MYFSESQTNTRNVIFGKIIPVILFYVTEMSIFRKIIPKTNIYVCNLFWPECKGAKITAPARQKMSLNYPQIVHVNLAVNSAMDFVMIFHRHLALSKKARIDLRYTFWNSRRNLHWNLHRHEEKIVQNSFCRMISLTMTENIQDLPPGFEFRARLKFSSEPPTKAPVFVGSSEGRDWKFRARMKFSIDIEDFKRDCFSRLRPLGFSNSDKEKKLCLRTKWRIRQQGWF